MGGEGRGAWGSIEHQWGHIDPCSRSNVCIGTYVGRDTTLTNNRNNKEVGGEKGIVWFATDP